MDKMLTFDYLQNGNYLCHLDLNLLYPTKADLEKFNTRYEDFLTSDKHNPEILKRAGNTITYPHKSWIPNLDNGKPSILMLFGNPAPHSVKHDIYFAYEGSGTEHRFWKVLRELGFIDLHGKDSDIKEKFLALKYESPFRLGFDVIYTFPSSASKPKWSGVVGLEKLFGKKNLQKILEFEKQRIDNEIQKFLGNHANGIIISMQKDAYEAVASDKYSLKKAVSGELVGSYGGGFKVYGTPPTRWLYTKVMKNVLRKIKSMVV